MLQTRIGLPGAPLSAAEASAALRQHGGEQQRLLARVEGSAEKIGEAEKSEKAEEKETEENERNALRQDGDIGHADRPGDERDDEKDDCESEHGIPAWPKPVNVLGPARFHAVKQ